jgi:hypothetical protein
MSLALVFLIVALVLFVVAAFGVASGRINLIAAGLAFFVVYHVLARWP